MKHVLFLACAALCACTPAADGSTAAAPDTTQAASAPVGPVTAMPVAADAAADPATHRFAFEPRSETPGPSGVSIVGTEPGPCGTVLVARVSGIPLDDARVQPDWIVELDRAGKPARKWGVPYEALLVGMAGERVQVRTGSGTYWVDAAGAVEQVDANGIDAGGERPASLVDSGGAVECPAGLDGGAQGWQCAEVRDAAGASRRVAVENVCS